MESHPSPVFFESLDGRDVLCSLSGESGSGDPGWGEKLRKMTPNTTDGAKEKHLPVVTCDGNRVSIAVGDIFHPMEEAHYIAWVYLETCCGGHFRRLAPGRDPVAVFTLEEGETPRAAYAYCNLHGFWKTNLG